MADVILEITVPDAWVTKVLNAFNEVAGTQMLVETEHGVSGLDGRWHFQIGAKSSEETNKQFGERVLRELGKAVVNLVDKAEDEQRYRDEIGTIAPPVSDVPDDIIT